MTEQLTSDELFQRLEWLKQEIETLRGEGRRFAAVGQVLADPLNGSLGHHKSGYGSRSADANLPDTASLSERIFAAQGEHFDLLMNQSQHLAGFQRNAFMQELQRMQGRG